MLTNLYGNAPSEEVSAYFANNGFNLESARHSGWAGFLRWDDNQRKIAGFYSKYTMRQFEARDGIAGAIPRFTADISFNVGAGLLVAEIAPLFPILQSFPWWSKALGGTLGSEAMENLVGGGLAQRFITSQGYGENQVRVHIPPLVLVVSHTTHSDEIVYYHHQ